MQRSYLDHVANLLNCFVGMYPNETRAELMKYLADPNFPSPKLTPANKQQFVTELFTKKGANLLVQVVNDFAVACRGLSQAVPNQPLLQ